MRIYFYFLIYQKNQVQLCFSEPRRLSNDHVKSGLLIDTGCDPKTNVTSEQSLQEFELCFSFISFSLMNFNAGLMQQSTFYIFSIFKLSAFFVGCILRATLLIFRGFFYVLRWNVSKGFLRAPQRGLKMKNVGCRFKFTFAIVGKLYEALSCCLFSFFFEGFVLD